MNYFIIYIILYELYHINFTSRRHLIAVMTDATLRGGERGERVREVLPASLQIHHGIEANFAPGSLIFMLTKAERP